MAFKEKFTTDLKGINSQIDKNEINEDKGALKNFKDHMQRL